eukprot:gene40375-53369_t
MLLSSWGMPSRTVRRYETAGIRTLFPWQIQCLLANQGRCLKGGNLVYSAPTSGGKTMVAEILMLRSLALKGYGHGHGMVLFVVPFVSLAEEKAAYFQDMWAELH